MDRPVMNGPLSGSKRLAVGAVLCAMSLAVLDAGMANVALPNIARHFAVEPADAIIVVGAYQGTLLAGLLPIAHLASRTGHRRLFRAGIVVFAAAGLLASLAANFPLLAVSRALQGLGGAAIMALGISVLRAKLGDERLSQVIAWNALIVAISAAAGPMVGAILLTILAPQMLFAAGLPVAAVAFLMASRLDDDKPSGAAIDGAAILLYVVAVIALLAAVRLAWGSPLTAVASSATALITLRALVRHSRKRSAPLFPFDLLRRRAFAMQSAASVTCFLAQSTGLIALSFSVQSAPGRNAVTTGILMACWPLSVAAANVVASRSWFRAATWLQCGAGAAAMAAGLIAIAITANAVEPLALAVGPVLCGVGFGLFQLANNRALFLGAPAARSAATGGLQGTARLAGQSLGTFLVATLFVTVPQSSAPIAGAAAGAGFAFFAAMLSIAAGRVPSETRLGIPSRRRQPVESASSPSLQKRTR